MDIKTHLEVLLKLAMVDENFDDQERKMIGMIAKANGVDQEVMDELILSALKDKTDSRVPLPVLSDDEKFEYLYNIVQLMKIDSKVYLSEINFCEDMAVRLGFNKKVIGRLSRQIFSDPSITTDKDKLKSAVMKFKN